MRSCWSFLALGFWVSVLASLAGGGAEAGSGWPGLRGPNGDGAVRDARLFAQGASPALVLGWKRELGPGYSIVAADDARLVTMFSSGGADVAAAFDPATGRELWRYRIADTYIGHDGSDDGPISSPLLTGGRVYGLGPRGNLFALDAATGNAIWSKDLVKEQGAVSPYYGFTSSPILVDGVLVVEIGAGAGKAIAGFKPEDGSLLWSVGDAAINYHSPIAVTLGGRQQVVAADQKVLYGLDAKSGKVIWSYEHQGDESATGGQTIVPVPAGDGRFLLLNKADTSTMIQVAPGEAGAFKITELWTNNTIRGTYVIPVYHEGHVYGMTGHTMTCVDAQTGVAKWRSREPGDGFPTLVGDQLVIITKPGSLFVAEASPAGYHELAKLNLFEENSWSAVAFADGHLYARSRAHLARIDLAATAQDAGSIRRARVNSEFDTFVEEAGKAADKNAVIEAYLARQKAFPIIEQTGRVHFIYRGNAKDVGIVGDMIGFRREDPMKRLADTDLFYYTTQLEPDAAVTYGFLVDYAKPIADPRNPRPGKGLFGDVSLLTMPAWREPGWLAEAARGRQGRLEPLEFDSKVREGRKCHAQVYLPAGYDKQPAKRYPLLFVHDGKDALEQGGMKNALDQLVGVSVQPLIAVFLIPDQDDKELNQGQFDKYTEMLVTELIPKLDERYRTIKEPSSRAAFGAADGANAALFGVLGHPETFGRLGAQSATIMTAAEYNKQLPGAEEQPLVTYLAWGTYDLRSPHEAWDMVKGNRELWTMMRSKGYRPTGGEQPDGFGWIVWRAHLDKMLTALYPAHQD